MTHSLMSGTREKKQKPAGRAMVGTLLSVLVGVGLGLAAGMLWTSRPTQGRPAGKAIEAAGDTQALSEGTRAILKRLNAPIELRLYSTMDPVTAPEELIAFAHRVDQLMSAYQQESNGKIHVTRLTSLSYTNASAAVNNGLKPFTLNNGNECLLGLVVLYKGHQETVSQLVPEWEAAMEIDVSRAIQNVVNTVPVSSAPPPMGGPSKATMEDLKRLIPNLETVSLAEGTTILRDAALKEFEQAAKESQAQLNEAQQRLSQAQKSGSEADQQAAVKLLQEVQTAQSERLKEIATKSRAQIDALRAMKASDQQ